MWRPPERIKHDKPEPHWPTIEQAEKSKLFSPVELGVNTASTRTWVPAMVPWRATEEGYVTPEVLAWYERFAQGKPGVIVVEATGIRDIPSGPLLRIGDDRFIDGLSQLVKTVKEASEGETLVFIQLIDFLTVRRRPPEKKFFQRYLQPTVEHKARLAEQTGDEKFLTCDDDMVRTTLVDADSELREAVMSAREIESLRYGYRERAWDEDLPHIADLPKKLPGLFVDAAKRAKVAGFDGVELHYAHAYTMASFLSRQNDRQDKFGGSRERRLRLPMQVLTEVKQAVGAHMTVGLRMLVDEVIAGGSRVEDAMYYGVSFAGAGSDFISLSKGGKFEDAKQPKVGAAVYPYTGPSGYECMPTVHSDEKGPFGRNIELMAKVRGAIRDAGLQVPVIVAGGLCEFSQAEAVLQADKGDIIGSARQSLADPDWFLKMRLGKGDAIRRCDFTNYCEALDQKHEQVTCKLWDRKQLDEPDVMLDNVGRRRLVAPPWSND